MPVSPIVPRPEIVQARHWAAFYRLRGFQPLPMRPDAKRPLMSRYAHLWDTPAPDDIFERHPTHNLQVMTGRRWRLLVIDLDGPEAREWFFGLGRHIPRTWATHSGGNGLHLWFRLPEGIRHEIPRAVLWEGDGEHSAVERLCDRSLIVAPPSVIRQDHEADDQRPRRYRFASRSLSPTRLPMPADCPSWILRLKPVPKLLPELPASLPRAERRIVDSSRRGRLRPEEVSDAIHDKLSLATEWGLRIASLRPNASGWCSCHAIGREDKNPSASISALTGAYWEPGSRPIGFFELGVRLGVYADWRDAVVDLGDRFAFQPRESR